MEQFSGVSILTTNLESSIDTAFKRRLAFKLDFPMPEKEAVSYTHLTLPTSDLV